MSRVCCHLRAIIFRMPFTALRRTPVRAEQVASSGASPLQYMQHLAAFEHVHLTFDLSRFTDTEAERGTDSRLQIVCNYLELYGAAKAAAERDGEDAGTLRALVFDEEVDEGGNNPRGPVRARVLSIERCRELLATEFAEPYRSRSAAGAGDAAPWPSFSKIATFLNVLSDQLRKFARLPQCRFDPSDEENEMATALLRWGIVTALIGARE